jgi:hypothetical protein
MGGGGVEVEVGEGAKLLVVAGAADSGAVVDASEVDVEITVVSAAFKSAESKRRVVLRTEGEDDDADGDGDNARKQAAPTMQTCILHA